MSPRCSRWSALSPEADLLHAGCDFPLHSKALSSILSNIVIEYGEAALRLFAAYRFGSLSRKRSTMEKGGGGGEKGFSFEVCGKEREEKLEIKQAGWKGREILYTANERSRGDGKPIRKAREPIRAKEIAWKGKR